MRIYYDRERARNVLRDAGTFFEDEHGILAFILGSVVLLVQTTVLLVNCLRVAPKPNVEAIKADLRRETERVSKQADALQRRAANSALYYPHRGTTDPVVAKRAARKAGK